LLVEGTTDHAIFMLSPEGLVLTWNAGAARIKGYSAAEVIRRHFSVFFTAEDIAAGHPDFELQTASREGSYFEEGWRVRKDGTLFWASVTITALRNEQGVLQGFGKVTRDLTERRDARDAMAQARGDQHQIFETLAEGVILYAVADGAPQRLTVEVANAAALAILGVDRSTLSSMVVEPAAHRDIVDSNGKPMDRAALPFAVTARTGQSVSDFVWGWRTSGGERRWLSSHSRALVGPAESTAKVVFSMADITDRHNAKRELEIAHARFSALVEHGADVICIVDLDTVVRYASPAYQGVYGEDPEVRLGRPLSELIHAEDREKLLDVLTEIAVVPGMAATVECRIVRIDGTIRHLEVTAANHVSDPAVAGIVTNSRDVTDRVQTATRLAYDAMHDALTGLPNRALLLDRLGQALARAERPKSHCALLFIDLDHFKHVNDSLGHHAGDELLGVIGDRLQQILRPGDTVARLGGDEFVILAERVSNPGAAHVIAERARQAVNEPVEIVGQILSIGCSIGIALSDGNRAEVLLQQADTALYKAKARGRGRWELYDQAMRISAQRRLETEALVRDALRNEHVVVHYQPIVDLQTGAHIGSEALVRILDSREKLVSPDDFVPVAEESGLIIPLGLEVLRQACEHHATSRRCGSAVARISVNLSAKQLRTSGLVQDVSGALADAGLTGSDLCLELTESALIEADDLTRRAVQQLTDCGIAIALDDFGTGMSSLVHLREFPIRELKIDRSFVAGLGENARDTEVVKAVISLGRALGLDTVAEGVETERQATILAELGCALGQGYLYGRPAPTIAR
jgi:diguanylate cyclase (GGDEF)-like protein/PAS domain S-box-containing protein